MRALDWIKGCFDKEARARRSLKRDIQAVKWESYQQTVRPFSDKYDESAGGGGLRGGAPAQLAYRRGLSELAKQIEARPPCEPHPRARRAEEEVMSNEEEPGSALPPDSCLGIGWVLSDRVRPVPWDAPAYDRCPGCADCPPTAEQLIEARVRAELANEADRRADGYVGDGAVWVARDVLREFAEDIRANRLSLAAGSSPDTTPPQIKVNLITHWLPFSLAAENHPFTDEQRQALAGHEDHQTAGAWSAFGWRELRCVTCDLVLWSVTTPKLATGGVVQSSHVYLVGEKGPEPLPGRCGICGGLIFAGGCERHHDTTPEPKRRYPRTTELTDQERYEIEEASAATWADPADREDS